jgi:chemotaxis protein CheC
LAENEKTSLFDLSRWSQLAQIGSVNAITGLSEMVNQEIKVTALDLEEVSVRNASGLIGKPEDLIVSIYLLFSGNTSGQIMLAFKPEIAFALVDMAMGIPEGTTSELGEMERSVLGEMGNIVGTFFLNAVADHAGVCLSPSPPAVVMDMSGALIDAVITEALSEKESIFVIRLSFSTPDRQLEGRFLVLPVTSPPPAGTSGSGGS